MSTKAVMASMNVSFSVKVNFISIKGIFNT